MCNSFDLDTLVPELSAEMPSVVASTAETKMPSAVEMSLVDAKTQVPIDASNAAERLSQPRSVLDQHQQQKSARPLSAIWETAAGNEPSPLSPGQIPMNVSGLFGNGGIVDAAAAMWLPTTPSKTADTEV